MPAIDPGTLLAGLDANTLQARGWPERHFLLNDALPRLPRRLQALAAEPVLSLFDRYRGRLSFGRGAKTVQSLDSAAHPAHLFAMGLTVYLHDLTPWYAELPPLLAKLEQELQIPAGSARLAAFASPQGDGLPAHFDGEDVISIQLQGRKRFCVAPVEGLQWPVGPQFGPDMLPADDLYPQCAENGFPVDIPADAETITMQPGSVLFLPRGIWHQTEALVDSLSLSIVLRPPTLADALLRELKQRLLQEPAWRQPLYGASDLAGQAGALLAELPTLTSSIDAQSLLPGKAADERLRRATFLRIPGSTLTLESASPALQLTVTARDAAWIERITLQRPVGANLAPALQWIAERRTAFDLATLRQQVPGLPPDSYLNLIRGLAEAALLRVLG